MTRVLVLQFLTDIGGTCEIVIMLMYLVVLDLLVVDLSFQTKIIMVVLVRSPQIVFAHHLQMDSLVVGVAPLSPVVLPVVPMPCVSLAPVSVTRGMAVPTAKLFSVQQLALPIPIVFQQVPEISVNVSQDMLLLMFLPHASNVPSARIVAVGVPPTMALLPVPVPQDSLETTVLRLSVALPVLLLAPVPWEAMEIAISARAKRATLVATAHSNLTVTLPVRLMACVLPTMSVHVPLGFLVTNANTNVLPATLQVVRVVSLLLVTLQSVYATEDMLGLCVQTLTVHL